MARKYPKKTIIWYGVYRKFLVFGSWCRSLEFVFATETEAKEKIEEILKTHSWKKAEEYIVEEVDVTMRAWAP